MNFKFFGKISCQCIPFKLHASESTFKQLLHLFHYLLSLSLLFISICDCFPVHSVFCFHYFFSFLQFCRSLCLLQFFCLFSISSFPLSVSVFVLTLSLSFFLLVYVFTLFTLSLNTFSTSFNFLCVSIQASLLSLCALSIFLIVCLFFHFHSFSYQMFTPSMHQKTEKSKCLKMISYQKKFVLAIFSSFLTQFLENFTQLQLHHLIGIILKFHLKIKTYFTPFDKSISIFTKNNFLLKQ